MEGDELGLLLGLTDGTGIEGETLGDLLGLLEGLRVWLGDLLGLLDGLEDGAVGLTEGLSLGDVLGLDDGLVLGDNVGVTLGDLEGYLVGEALGDLVGLVEGLLEGDCVGEVVGCLVGAEVGGLVITSNVATISSEMTGVWVPFEFLVMLEAKSPLLMVELRAELTSLKTSSPQPSPVWHWV